MRRTSQWSEWRLADSFGESECAWPPPSLTSFVKQRLVDMSQFVNYSKRGVELPPGCKDLIDLLSRDKDQLPDVVRKKTEGLRQLDDYVAGLLSSPAEYRLLSILGFGVEAGVFLEYSKGALSAIVVIKTADSAEEHAVRESFRLVGVSPLSDQAPCGAAGARVLSYPLPASIPDVVALIREVLRVACGATEHAGLYFDYHGNTAA